MANLNITEVEGFDTLNTKLKKLSDSVKRKEVLGVQRQLAKTVKKAYASNLPVDSGTLSKSVAIKTVSIRKSGGNPQITVEPGKSGRNNAYYKFMVVPKGTVLGSNKRGSRSGKTTVVPNARNKTLSQIGSSISAESETKMAKYIQTKINKLSTL